MKFNGFENHLMTEALKRYIKFLEEENKEMQKGGRMTMFAEGYFEMVGEELLGKVKKMTLKKDLKPFSIK